jgi:hypothetical protein
LTAPASRIENWFAGKCGLRERDRLPTIGRDVSYALEHGLDLRV